MDRLRIVQWNTGKVGKMALRAIMDDPRLELVGVYAWSPDKVGQDAGELCGRPPCGVHATDDVAALVALKSDAVIYSPFNADLDHLVRLLESGSDVVSTNLLANLGGIEGEVEQAIATACERGGSSLHITGINPGWLDALAATVTAICRGIEEISVTESVSVAHYESVETWQAVGMGMAAKTPEVVERARGALLSFRDSVMRLADAMELPLDEVGFVCDFATTPQRLDLGWFAMEAGTHAALRAGWDGKVGGRTVIRYRVIWYMTKALVEGWEIDPDNYHVRIQGEPDLYLRVGVTPPAHWGHAEHAICTALPAVSSVFRVRAGRPGILGLADLGPTVAPVGLWLER